MENLTGACHIKKGNLTDHSERGACLIGEENIGRDIG
jgi:hypothetical protein